MRPVGLAGHVVVHVAAALRAELGGDTLTPLVENVADDDPGALGDEVACVRLAHAPGGARDERDLPVETPHLYSSRQRARCPRPNSCDQTLAWYRRLTGSPTPRGAGERTCERVPQPPRTPVVHSA